MDEGCLIIEVFEALHRSGFPLVGTCSAASNAEDTAHLKRWIEGGLHGPLAYMKRHAEILLGDASPVESWARGCFCVAMPYNTRRDLSARAIGSGAAWVSRYAWGRDYHKVLRARMRPAAERLREAGCRARICVDTAPLLERALAARAGLGFIGKSGLLIHPRLGSYLFLGEILTDLELPDGERMADGCGACSLCMKGCPTGALIAPRVLDAGRCISAWTIEHRGPFPTGAPPLHGHVFGCDRCQEVCPFNREAPLSEEPDFAARAAWFAPDPVGLAGMGEDEWDRATRGSAVRRAKYEGLRRNARRILEEMDDG